MPFTAARWLAGAGASPTAIALPGHCKDRASASRRRLPRAARPHRPGPVARSEYEPTPIWGYDGMVPGPTLRVKQGEELKVRLVNDLNQPTTVHWHGLRIDNAMDGVPHLTQKPIEPGASFDYRCTAAGRRDVLPYHTHFLSSEQLARGLYAPLVVEEREPGRSTAIWSSCRRLAADGRWRDPAELRQFSRRHDGRPARPICHAQQPRPARLAGQNQRAAAATHRQHRQFAHLPVAHRQTMPRA